MSSAVINSPSASIEDYAKAIYSLTRESDDAAASTNDLAARLGISTGSVSTRIKRLDAAGLAEHVPYRGVRLTAEGRRLALRVMRRHRLLELFLVTSLNLSWDDVHHHAEILEHAASDELIEIIDAHLGHPTVDPHGDPIPDRDLTITELDSTPLTMLQVGDHATLVRVSDSQPEMLRYLAARGIGIGTELTVLAHEPFDGPIMIEVEANQVPLGTPLANAMYTRRHAAR